MLARLEYRIGRPAGVRFGLLVNPFRELMPSEPEHQLQVVACRFDVNRCVTQRISTCVCRVLFIDNPAYRSNTR